MTDNAVPIEVDLEAQLLYLLHRPLLVHFSLQELGEEVGAYGGAHLIAPLGSSPLLLLIVLRLVLGLDQLLQQLLRSQVVLLEEDCEPHADGLEREVLLAVLDLLHQLRVVELALAAAAPTSSLHVLLHHSDVFFKFNLR